MIRCLYVVFALAPLLGGVVSNGELAIDFYTLRGFLFDALTCCVSANACALRTPDSSYQACHPAVIQTTKGRTHELERRPPAPPVRRRARGHGSRRQRLRPRGRQRCSAGCPGARPPRCGRGRRGRRRRRGQGQARAQHSHRTH